MLVIRCQVACPKCNSVDVRALTDKVKGSCLCHNCRTKFQVKHKIWYVCRTLTAEQKEAQLQRRRDLKMWRNFLKCHCDRKDTYSDTILRDQSDGSVVPVGVIVTSSDCFGMCGDQCTHLVRLPNDNITCNHPDFPHELRDKLWSVRYIGLREEDKE
jgi:hypothetical protein